MACWLRIEELLIGLCSGPVHKILARDQMFMKVPKNKHIFYPLLSEDSPSNLKHVSELLNHSYYIYETTL